MDERYSDFNDYKDYGRSRGRRRGRNVREPDDGGRIVEQEKRESSIPSKVRKILILCIAEVIVLVGIFAYAYVLRQYGKIQRLEFNEASVKNQNLSIEKLQEMEEGYWNIAVFGIDSRDSSIGKGNNSDVIIIVNINKATGEIKLVSVFRDTYLKIGDDAYNKINAAYCNGGPEQALKALNDNLDLNITDYATFNWKAVATAVNILGGVDVEISKAEFYYINAFITETVKGTGIGSVQLTHAGMNHLDGVQAVAYARLRYMDNDYARTERQRKIIQLCFDKCKTADAKTLNDLLGNMLEMIATNMTWQHGIDAIAQLDKYHIGETGGFPFARGEAVIGKRGSCVIPQTLISNVSQLHKFFFDIDVYEPSETVRTISAKISADSGMYNEGTAVGHVSTEGYIPKPTVSSSESEEEESGDGSSLQSVINVEGLESNETGKKKVEYAISRDGYLIYVDSVDGDGNKLYKYVIGDDGKRIKMIERDADGQIIYLYETDENGNFIFGDDESTGEEQTPESETDAPESPSDTRGSGTPPEDDENLPSHPGDTRRTTDTERPENTGGNEGSERPGSTGGNEAAERPGSAGTPDYENVEAPGASGDIVPGTPSSGESAGGTAVPQNTAGEVTVPGGSTPPPPGDEGGIIIVPTPN